jgi:hypothetical protein
MVGEVGLPGAIGIHHIDLIVPVAVALEQDPAVSRRED